MLNSFNGPGHLVTTGRRPGLAERRRPRIRAWARATLTALLVVAAAAVLGGASESRASSSGKAHLRWSPGAGSQGTKIWLRGGGFTGRRAVGVRFGGVKLRAGRTDSRGRISARVAVPPLRPGRYAVKVNAGSSRVTFRFLIIATAVPPSSSPPAPPVTVPPALPAPEPPGPPTPQPQPTFPIRAAFYYPWFPEAWTQQGITPFTKYTPSLGYYNSDDQAVRLAHLRALEYAHFDAGIYSWWGQGHKTDLRFPGMLQETNAINSPIKWTLYYEREGNPGGNGPNPTVDQLGSDLDYVKSHYASDPAYLRVGGKPVIFAYADASDDCTTADRWKQANTASRDFYVVLKVFSGYRTCASQPDAWHQYAPSSRQDRQRGYSFVISPEFDLTGPEPERLPRDLAAFQQAAANMVASGEPWQLVTTFNEWGENSATESAAEWASPSGHGQYLDALAAL